MPKKASRKKTTKRPKKVSRKKSKRVTKRKPKYKKRKRRFGMFTGLQSYLGRYSDQLSPKVNTPIERLATGKEHKKSFDYKGFLQRLSGEKGIQALYHKIGSGDLRKIGKNEPDDKLRRHKAFHTVLVAIISAILQLTDRVGRLQGSKIYTKARQESKFLSIFSKRQTYSDSGLQKYANLPRAQTDITDFEIIDRNGVVMGFKHKFRGNTFEVSMTGEQRGNNLFINTLFTDLESRLPALREDSKVDPAFLSLAEAYPKAYHDSYTTVVNLNTGAIVSTQDPQNNNQVEQLTTELGTMSVNRENTIVTSAGFVNKTFKTFENPSEKELTEGIKKLSITGNPFDDDDLFSRYAYDPLQDDALKDDDPEIEILKDGKPFAEELDDGWDGDGDFGDVDFGRRKRKRKVSKKKVSKKKVSKKKVSKKKGPSAALKKLCKRLKVKLTTKRAGKRVYKSEKVLKGLCKKAAKKSSFGKKPTKIPSALKKKCKKYNIRLTTGKKRVPKTLKKLKKDLDDKLKKIKIRKQKGRAKMIKKAPFYAKKYARLSAKRSLTKRATGALLRSVVKGRPSLFGKNRDIEAVKNTKCEKIKGCNGKPKCCKRVKKALINMYKGKATAADKKLIVSKKHFTKGDVDIINYCWNPKNSWKCRGAGIATGGVIGGLSGLLLSRSLKKKNMSKNKIDMSKIPQVDFGKKKKRRRKRTSE